jgi:hypothetical protein
MPAPSAELVRLPEKIAAAAGRELGASGLFVPKPSRGVDCQHFVMPGLAAAVRQCPLASATGGGDCYSLGYSAPGRRRLDHLVAKSRQIAGYRG